MSKWLPTLAAGKHVLCEEPLCTNAAAGEPLVALGRRRGLVLMVGHIFLFNAGIRKMKGLVDAGEVGAVRSMSLIRTNLGPVRSDVNPTPASTIRSRCISTRPT